MPPAHSQVSVVFSSGSREAMHLMRVCSEMEFARGEILQKAIEWYRKAMDTKFPAAFGSMGSLISSQSAENLRGRKITEKKHEENMVLGHHLYEHGVELGDVGSKSQLELDSLFAEKRETLLQELDADFAKRNDLPTLSLPDRRKEDPAMAPLI